MDGLDDELINPDKKKGNELIAIIPLSVPKTLKKLNGARLDNSSK